MATFKWMFPPLERWKAIGSRMAPFLHNIFAVIKHLFNQNISTNEEQQKLICVLTTNKMHFSLVIYFNNYSLNVSDILTIHRQEISLLYVQNMVFILHLR